MNIYKDSLYANSDIYGLYNRFRSYSGTNEYISRDVTGEYDGSVDNNANGVNEFNEYIEHLYNLGYKISAEIRHDCGEYIAYQKLGDPSIKIQYIRKLDPGQNNELIKMIVLSEKDNDILACISSIYGIEDRYRAAFIKFIRCKYSESNNTLRSIADMKPAFYQQIKKIDRMFASILIKKGYFTLPQYLKTVANGSFYNSNGIGYYLIAYTGREYNYPYFKELIDNGYHKNNTYTKLLDVMKEMDKRIDPYEASIISRYEHGQRNNYAYRQVVNTSRSNSGPNSAYAGEFIKNYSFLDNNELNYILEVEPAYIQYASNITNLLNIMTTKTRQVGIIRKIYTNIHGSTNGINQYLIDKLHIYTVDRGINCFGTSKRFAEKIGISSSVVPDEHIALLDSVYIGDISDLSDFYNDSNKYVFARVFGDGIIFNENMLSRVESIGASFPYLHEIGHVITGGSDDGIIHGSSLEEFARIAGWETFFNNRNTDDALYGTFDWQIYHNSIKQPGGGRYGKVSLGEDFATMYSAWYEGSLKLIEYSRMLPVLNNKTTWLMDRIFTFYRNGSWNTRFYGFYRETSANFLEYYDFKRTVASREGDQIQFKPLEQQDLNTIEHQLYIEYSAEKALDTAKTTNNSARTNR